MTSLRSSFATVTSFFRSIQYRDGCFWLGLALAWVGLAGSLSRWVASSTVGAVLIGVAIFGVAPSKGGS